MNTVIENVKKLGLIRSPKSGTSIEVLENMNKLNIIRNENISQNYATELFLSMCLRTDEDVKRFAKEYGVTGDLTVAQFFEEFRKVRIQKDRQVANYNNFKFEAKYYDLINNILKNQGTIIASVKEYVSVPTISDYLAIAKKENTKAKAQHADLDSEINNEDNITGNSRPEYKRFLIDNYKEQILKVSKGFNVRMVMVSSKNLSNGQLKLMSKFKNIKTSTMARVINKRGGCGYLSSPTRERQVTYYPLDKRFFAPVSQEKPKDLSYNEILFYSVYDLNGRALKYKKSYISNAITKATGEKATGDEVKLITDLTRNLATRYMLFGLDLNNATGFDPNVVFDYRLEALFMNKLEKINDKENNRWILPIVQELAGNMAVEFFKNAEISPLTVRDNLISASKYLPEFERGYDGKSFAGVLFNSETSTYNLGRNANKVKPLKKTSILSKIKGKLGLITGRAVEENAKAQQQNIGGKEFEPEQKPNTQGKGEEKAKKISEVEYSLFGKKRVFKAFTFDEYCDHFVKNILEPCANAEKLPKAKTALDKYKTLEKGNLTTKEKLVSVMGESTLNNFYDRYLDYAINEAKVRSENCEAFANIITNEITSVIDNRIKAESKIKDESGEIKNKERVADLSNLAEAVKNDVSLSNIDDMENLIKIVVSATKIKAEKGNIVADNKAFLNAVCKRKTDKELNAYIGSLVDKYLASCQKAKNNAVNEKKNNGVAKIGEGQKNGEVDGFDAKYIEMCKASFTKFAMVPYLNLINRENEAKDVASKEEKLGKEKHLNACYGVFTEFSNGKWYTNPEFKKLNDRYATCRDCMLGNEALVDTYIKDYVKNNEKAMVEEFLEIVNARLNGNTQGKSNIGVEQKQNDEENLSSFEQKLKLKMFHNVKMNSDRVHANNIIKDYQIIKVREIDNKYVTVTIKDVAKTEQNVKENLMLEEFYNDIDEISKDLKGLKLKAQNEEDLSIAEKTWLEIVKRKDAYVDCFERGSEASELDYLYGIEEGFKFEINKILEDAENDFLATKGFVRLVQNKNTKIRADEKGESRLRAFDDTKVIVEPENPGEPIKQQPEQPEQHKMSSIEKATKIKDINRAIKREVKIALDDKVESIHNDMAKMNSKSKTYKFYDLYAKTFASIRKIYDPNSSNAPYKGISQETTVGIKDKIDKYIKREIVAKINADPEFESLSVEELVEKHTNKEHLKYFVTEVIERSNSALVADSYKLDIFGRKRTAQNDKLISVDEFEQNQANKTQSTGEGAGIISEGSEVVEEPEIVEVAEQVVENEPDVIDEIGEGHKKTEEDKKIEIAKMKNLSLRGNKIKECKAIIRNDVANILSEKVAITRDDMSRMNSKNSAYKFYDLYAKAFASVRKLYDSKASNTIYKGISEECALGIKKNIDTYIEKEIIAKIKNDPELDSADKEVLVEKYRDMEKLKTFVIDYIENNTNTLISNSYLVNLNLAIKRSPNKKTSEEPEYVKDAEEIIKE